MVKQPIIYVIQLNPPENYIVVNYCINKLAEDQLKELQTKFKKAVMRNDLLVRTDVDIRSVNGHCRELSHKLTSIGFIPVSGAVLMNNYWQLYVIRANTGDSKLLYVGSTQYPREMRFRQHVIGLRSANVFGKNRPHSLDNNLFDSSIKYIDKASAVKAEEKLAIALRKQHYDAKQA